MSTDVKAGRDGTVTKDGQAIGRVEKEVRQGIFATAFGVSASAGGTAYWLAYSADGTKLNEYGYDTRKAAVARIEKAARPFTIESFTLESGLMLSDEKCVTTTVTYGGYWFSVSRYANESYWVVDAMGTPDSIMPTFSNGTGSRVTAARTLNDEAAAKVTLAAESSGLWPIPE